MSTFFARKYVNETEVEAITSTRRLVPKIILRGILKKVEKIGIIINTPEAPVIPVIPPTIKPIIINVIKKL